MNPAEASESTVDARTQLVVRQHRTVQHREAHPCFGNDLIRWYAAPAVAMLLAMPSSGWAHGGGGGGPRRRLRRWPFRRRLRRWPFRRRPLRRLRGRPLWRYPLRGLPRRSLSGGYGYGYPHAYHHPYGFYGTYPYFRLLRLLPLLLLQPIRLVGPGVRFGIRRSLRGGDAVQSLRPHLVTRRPLATRHSPTAATSQPDNHRPPHRERARWAAQLWIEGTPTNSHRPGPAVRLAAARARGRYSYQVRVSWDENGHKVTQTQQVEVTAGRPRRGEIPGPAQDRGTDPGPQEGMTLAASIDGGSTSAAAGHRPLSRPGDPQVLPGRCRVRLAKVLKLLESEGYRYAIRLKANAVLERHIAHLLKRPVGRPSKKPKVDYHSFQYQAKSWDRARRVVAKIEWHAGELFPPGSGSW